MRCCHCRELKSLPITHVKNHFFLSTYPLHCHSLTQSLIEICGFLILFCMTRTKYRFPVSTSISKSMLQIITGLTEETVGCWSQRRLICEGHLCFLLSCHASVAKHQDCTTAFKICCHVTHFKSIYSLSSCYDRLLKYSGNYCKLCNFPVECCSVGLEGWSGRLGFTVKTMATVCACLWTDGSCPWSEVP